VTASRTQCPSAKLDAAGGRLNGHLQAGQPHNESLDGTLGHAEDAQRIDLTGTCAGAESHTQLAYCPGGALSRSGLIGLYSMLANLSAESYALVPCPASGWHPCCARGVRWASRRAPYNRSGGRALRTRRSALSLVSILSSSGSSFSVSTGSHECFHVTRTICARCSISSGAVTLSH
jgi:hypothetical protein